METKNFTVEDALPIAERHIAATIANSERLRRYEFGPVLYCRENDRVWTFAAGSRQLQEEGRVPGAIFASIDKVDGHVWSNKEQERYAQSRSPYPPPPRPISANGTPMMDVEDALEIAGCEIERIIKQNEAWRGLEFSVPRLSGLYDQCWFFSAEAAPFAEDGSGQAEVVVCLDPFDGHILRAEEQAHLTLTRNFIKRAAQPVAIAA